MEINSYFLSRPGVTFIYFQILTKTSWKSHNCMHKLHAQVGPITPDSCTLPSMPCKVLVETFLSIPLPLAALLNTGLLSVLIDMIIQARNPFKTNSFESHQLASCPEDSKFVSGVHIIQGCSENSKVFQ